MGYRVDNQSGASGASNHRAIQGSISDLEQPFTLPSLLVPPPQPPTSSAAPVVPEANPDTSVNADVGIEPNDPLAPATVADAGVASPSPQLPPRVAVSPVLAPCELPSGSVGKPPMSTHRPAPIHNLLKEVSGSSAVPHPQPQQHASSNPPNRTSTPAMEPGTKSRGPEPFSSASGVLGDALEMFGGDDDLSDPPSRTDEEEDRNEMPAVDAVVHRSHLHVTAKRSRAASSSSEAPAQTPKRRRRARSAANQNTATPKASNHPPRRAPTNRSKNNEADDSDVDMEVGFYSSAEREDGDEGGIVGKGKAVNNKAHPSGKTSAPGAKAKKAKNNQAPRSRPSYDVILSLGKEIPATYEALQDPLEEDELLESDWFAPAHTDPMQGKPSEKGKKNPTAPVEDAPPNRSQGQSTRRWHSFTAPRMTLDHEPEDAGEVKLSDSAFCFPFDAQVNKCFSS
jgi:hypothetical protein